MNKKVVAIYKQPSEILAIFVNSKLGLGVQKGPLLAENVLKLWKNHLTKELQEIFLPISST